MKGEGRIVVIADDITGAAEIAGIAKRHGLHTELLTFTPSATHGRSRLLSRPQPGTQVVVVATDTRSGSKEEAIATVRLAAQQFAGADSHLTPYNGPALPGPARSCLALPGARLFKKTDSALRGHIAAELTALMEATGYKKTLLIAQNPSKGRIISGGTYYINGVPLADTAFRYDPEFPAVTSTARDIVGGNENIIIADAVTAADVYIKLSETEADTLVAGAADCFEAFLTTVGADSGRAPHPRATAQTLHTSHFTLHTPHSPFIIVCGSTQSRSLEDEPFIRQSDAEEIGLPVELFHGRQSPEAWFERLQQSYSRHNAIVVTIGQPSTGGKDYAVRLRNLMAEAVGRLVSARQPATLVIEGGATAFATLQQLGWQVFTITAELAPGVVSMDHKGTAVILKPGSYPWGNLFTLKS